MFLILIILHKNCLLGQTEYYIRITFATLKKTLSVLSADFNCPKLPDRTLREWKKNISRGMNSRFSRVEKKASVSIATSFEN